MKFKINQKLFEKYPDLFEAVVILKNINNKIDGREILDLLRNEEEVKKTKFKSKQLSDHSTIKSWREAFRDFGSKPNKYSSSVEALLKRVLSGNELPDINPLVNLYNYCSIKHILPFGGEDFAGVYGNMELKYCEGTEEYIPIMGKENEPPDKGEIAWVDASGITCRKWNWRQCDRTKITEDSKEGYFIIDGIPPATKLQVEKAANDFIAEAKKYLGAKGEIYWLDKQNPEAEIDIKTQSPPPEADQPMAGKLKAHKSISDPQKSPTKHALSKDILEDAKRLKRDASAPKLDEVNFDLLRYQIQDVLFRAVKKAGFPDMQKENIKVEHPADESFGDYATNIAMMIAVRTRQNPEKIAENIIQNLDENSLIQEVQFKSGFINIKLSKEFLLAKLAEIIKEGNNFGKLRQKNPIRLIVEFGQPNTHKMPHIGHLFSFIIGESISRTAKFAGYEVFQANYQGDVGPHVAKCIWAYLRNKPEIPVSYREKAMLLQQMYQEGATAYKENDKAKEEIDEINKKIYLKDPSILDIWKETREWSVKFYKEFEEKLGVHYDRYYYESEAADPGKKIVEENVGKVFKESEGAIIFEGSKHGLHDRVFITKKGTPTYEAKDMALQPLKYKEWPFEKMVIMTAHEQNEYFSVVFKALETLDQKFQGKLMHLGFGMVNLKSGKMSSRTGNIITGISLIEQGIDAVKLIIQDKEGLAKDEVDNITEKVGIAAVKYSLLKGNPLQNVSFDFKESISFEGNSGPYLQYTYARAKSILKEASPKTLTLEPVTKFNPEELALLRTFYRFPEIVSESAKNLSPNIIAGYLFDLAQKFNLFYKKHPVLKADEGMKQTRLAITRAVAQVLKNGLFLLGIDTLEKM
ncbi:MAG: arginine--tRNA ligase [Candidatus Dojkabacteria bacterium]|nr:arginine--tRNA ligase [Candidatus Dojkabacteria bacterium]